MGPDVSLVIPTYNEKDRLPLTLDALSAFSRTSGLALQIIVADDGSHDSTPDLARRWASTRATELTTVEVTVIAHRGKGAAVRAGLARATAPIVGYCDADLSAGVDALEAVYRAVKDGSDFAVASRGLPDSVIESRQPWYRERAGRVFNRLLRVLVAGVEVRDTQCGLKLLRQNAAREIFRHQRVDGFAFDAELVVLAVRLGFDVTEVPVRWRHDPRSTVSMSRDSLKMARDLLRIVRRLHHGRVHELGIPASDAMEMMAMSQERHWWYVSKRMLVRQHLPDLQESWRCLDVGCGAGAELAEIATTASAFGVDLSQQALQHGRSLGLETLVRAEAGILPFRDSAFHVVLALDVLEHHPRPEEMLAEVRRVLSPEGRLVVTVPAFQWMWSYADHLLGHYRRYTRQRLGAELAASGFTIQRLTYFHSWLLPMAWVFRKLRALLGRTDGGDDFMLPGPINTLLLGLSRLEQRFLTSHDLPFGLSVIAVAIPTSKSAQALSNQRTSPQSSSSEILA